MLKIFKAPVFQDTEQTRKAQILHSLIKGTMIIISIELIIFIIAVPQNYLRWIAAVSLIDIPGFVFLFINRKGFTTLSSGLFTGLCVAMVVALSSTVGGLRAPAWQIIPVLVLMVGLTRGWKAGMFVGLLVSIFGLGLVFAEYSNILPASRVAHNTFTLWIGSFTSIALISMLQFNTVENLNKAFKKVSEELNMRKKAEKELFSSEAFRKRVFETSMTPIVVMDRQSLKFIDCNPAAISIYGFASREETLGKTPLDVSATEQYDGQLSSVKAKLYIDEAIEKGQVVFEWLHQRPNSELWDAEVHLMSFEAENRQLLQFTLLDITDKVKTKKSLDETESRIKSIGSNFTAGMIYQVVINKNGSRMFTYLSDSVKKLYGVTPDEGMLDANLIYNKIHPDDIQLLINSEEEAIKNLSVFKSEARVINPSGDVRWSSFVSTPKKTEDGALCFDGIEFIITERKQAEEALNIKAAQLKANLDKTPNVAIQWYDQEGKVLFWNPASETMYGWSSDEALGKTLDLLIHTPEEAGGFLKILKNIGETGHPFGPFESEIKRRDGRKGWVLATTISFPMGDGKLGYACMDVDITERKLAEEALIESEDRFKTLSSIASEGLMIHENGIIVDMNQAFARLQGCSSIDELVGKEALETIQFTAESKQLVYDHFISKSDETFDIEIINQYGEIIPAETRGSQIVYKGRKANLVYMRDISERKKAEKALVESEKKYRYLMENMNEVVMMVDNDDRVLFVNNKFTEKLGYTPEEIIGEIGYERLIDHSDRKVIIEENKKRIEKQINQYELSFIAKDGHKIDFLISGAPMIDPEGKTIGSIGTMTDITSRKQAEKALKESEELFKNLIELTPYGIALNDLQSRYLMVNRAFCDDWGLEPNEIIGKTNEEFGLLVDAELRNTLKNELMQKGFFKNIEGTIRSKQGNTIYCLFSGRIIQMNDQNVLMTSSVNITEKKKIEKELEKYRNHLETLVKERTDELAATNEELNATNEELYDQREELRASLNKLNETQKRLVQSEKMASLGILSAGIAHEINNPLNFIQGGILVIENYSKSNLEEHLQELIPFIDAIQTGVKRATDIVTSLSHYSRKDDFPMAECNIHSIIDHCLIMLQNQLKNKVEIEKLYTDKPHIFIGSEGKMHQAILNIISNAEQAIETKGRLIIKTEIIQNELIITIKDSGIGISHENLLRIFDPFFTTKDPGKGTGLGLAITFNIIHDHHGTIEFDSSLGHGTTAIIKLPIIKTD